MDKPWSVEGFIDTAVSLAEARNVVGETNKKEQAKPAISKQTPNTEAYPDQQASEEASELTEIEEKDCVACRLDSESVSAEKAAKVLAVIQPLLDMNQSMGESEWCTFPGTILDVAMMKWPAASGLPVVQQVLNMSMTGSMGSASFSLMFNQKFRDHTIVLEGTESSTPNNEESHHEWIEK